MSEFVIEKLTPMEQDKLFKSNTDIEWFPDNMFDVMNSDICINGTKKDVETILKIIGRNKK